MTRSALLAILELLESEPSIEVLIFGSALTTPRNAVDLDLIIVYEDQGALERFVSGLSEALPAWPLDITAMSTSEARESRFIGNSGAVSVGEAVRRGYS